MQSATLAIREFLSTDASEPALVVADVITEGSDEDFLHLESTFRLGDGETFTNIDLSVFGSMKDETDRDALIKSLKSNLSIVRNLMRNVEEWGQAYTEAALEAIGDVQSTQAKAVEATAAI